MQRWVRFFKWSVIGLSVLTATTFAINYSIKSVTSDRIFEKPHLLPTTDVALVLGTSPRLEDGYRNLFFEHRMDAAAELFKSGKVRHLLVSGANPSIYYNEPNAMLDALTLRGVPKEAITLDYAGLRTLDSIVRSKVIFKQSRLVVVTQRFHLHRSLYLADAYGIEAVGFAARPVPKSLARKTHFREFLARVKAFLDLKVIGKQPRFLGDPEPIQLPSTLPVETRT